MRLLGFVLALAVAVPVAASSLECVRPAPGAAEPWQATFRISNEGLRPSDPAFLRPDLAYPGDKSIQPWMILEHGDSYALEARVTKGPPGTRIKLVDSGGNDLPRGQVDFKGHPYIVVPWNASRLVRVVAMPPPNSTAMAVTVHLRIWSLNNEVVNAAADVQLSATGR